MVTNLSRTEINAEFDRQVQTFLTLGYPDASGLSQRAFISAVEPLREVVHQTDIPRGDEDEGTLPFVIVVSSASVPVGFTMSKTVYDGKAGQVKLYPLEPSDFSTVPDIRIPSGRMYVAIGVDRGASYLNVPPDRALDQIRHSGRSPLTIEEGIAAVTLFPRFLRKNNCFSLSASRHPGDKRVPAIWINGKKQPNLGWCWAGNPHTWLGSASCLRRLGF